MLPDRVLNPGPLTYETGALPIELRGPAMPSGFYTFVYLAYLGMFVLNKLLGTLLSVIQIAADKYELTL